MRRRPRPDPLAPGTLVVVVAGAEKPLVVELGQSLVVGRDPESAIVLADPSVSPSHVLIARAGPGWLVRSLDPANLAYLLDPTGRAQPIEAELGLRSGELLVGGYQVKLLAPGV
jgi:pSer/pThr/pTyr-binding forkhead associated (FHA) protein